jgi:hypothetical protein
LGWERATECERGKGASLRPLPDGRRGRKSMAKSVSGVNDTLMEKGEERMMLTEKELTRIGLMGVCVVVNAWCIEMR